MLSFGKPSEPHFQRINPNSVIEQAIHLIENQCNSKRINIDRNLAQGNITIQADANQLQQALLNIILNAIDAMPDGGILTISSFVIPAKAGIHHFNITISDTGLGIDPKDLPHIFEPFYSKKDKGTGLGLSITQGIIEKHGGKIAVKSAINKGTTFKLTLDLK